MTATSLQFGPEWMRNKQQAARSPPSMSLPGTSPPTSSSSGATQGASTYSSLLSSAAYETSKAGMPLQDGGGQQGQIGAIAATAALNPFRYTKEEMLQVWRLGGGRGGLGLEVEQWEGVVKELGGEPIGLRDMSEGERKLFSLPLNSELRRRQSHDFLPNSVERPNKLGHAAPTTLVGQRFGSLLARKRKEDGGGDAGPVPRRLSLTSLASPLGTPLSPTGPGLPSPRPRIGSGTGSVYDGPAESWRKRDPDPTRLGGVLTEERDEGPGGIPATDTTSGSSPDTSSRSVSARSMAPSPPSVRDDSGLPGSGGGVDDLAVAVNVLSVLDEGKQPPGGVHADDGLYKSGVSVQRPLGLDNGPAAISWSYMDPKGNEQGPFSAAIMQKWYEEGYFSPELLMKRIHLDPGWTPVRDLLLRADHDKLFFSTFSAPPPGLPPPPPPPPPSHHTINGFDRYNMANFQGSEQFVNGTAFRHPTAPRMVSLDSYLGATSSHSPQPSVFNPGILGVQTASPDLAFRNPAFTPTVNGFDTQAPSSVAQRPGSVGFANSSFGPRLAALGHRTSAFEGQGGFGFPNSPAPSSPWGSGLEAGMNEYDGLAASRGVPNNGIYGAPSSIQGFSSQDEFAPSLYGASNVVYSQTLVASESGNQFGQGMRPLAEGEPGLQQPGLEITGGFGNQYPSGDPASIYGIHQQQQQQIPHHSSIPLQPTSVPWAIPSEIQARQRTFDPAPPSARNIITHVTTIVEPVISQTTTDDTVWAESEVEAPQPVQAASPVEAIQFQTSWNTPPPPSPVENEPATVSAPSDVPQPIITKKRRVTPPTAIPEAAAIVPTAVSSFKAPTAPTSKAAWATPTEDEKVPKTGLREIQEAEAKKAEARRLAEQKEREKERPARAGSHEEVQTFTASWGLPTSQVGAARTMPKELPAAGSATTPATAPVWTNAAKQAPVVKKSMLEIQEEEQRRKKAVVKEREMAAAVARRGYADSTNKNVTPAQPSGGAWTTVGASGKPTATRQVSANSQLSAPPVVRPNGIPAPRPSGAVPGPVAQVTKPLAPVAKQPPTLSDDLNPPPPSPEFMKWLRDNMREFSSGFNIEDFMQMILSFSLDFPQPIIELIQEQVYANSTTMNGQRFAAEFVAKRKADAANRPKTTSGKQPSLAEVVKTQPRPVQADLPFKVVKKKGRGQR